MRGGGSLIPTWLFCQYVAVQSSWQYVYSRWMPRQSKAECQALIVHSLFNAQLLYSPSGLALWWCVQIILCVMHISPYCSSFFPTPGFPIRACIIDGRNPAIDFYNLRVCCLQKIYSWLYLLYLPINLRYIYFSLMITPITRISANISGVLPRWQPIFYIYI